MFGKHFEEAEATVLFIAMDTHTKEWHNSAAEPRELFEVILDVRPHNGQLFRTSIKEHFNPYHSPNVGDVVKVQYDPKSKEVKITTKGDIRYDQHAKELARQAQHDQILAAPAGTPLYSTGGQPGYPTGGQAGGEDEELAELVRLELEEYRQRCNELQLNGSDGSATVLHIDEVGAAVPPLVCYAVDVEIRPLLGGARFTRTVAAWVDPRTHPIVVGSTVQVKYSQDTSRAIIL
jgi:hypothetical protein